MTIDDRVRAGLRKEMREAFSSRTETERLWAGIERGIARRRRREIPFKVAMAVVTLGVFAAILVWIIPAFSNRGHAPVTENELMVGRIQLFAARDVVKVYGVVSNDGPTASGAAISCSLTDAAGRDIGSVHGALNYIPSGERASFVLAGSTDGTATAATCTASPTLAVSPSPTVPAVPVYSPRSLAFSDSAARRDRRVVRCARDSPGEPDRDHERRRQVLDDRPSARWRHERRGRCPRCDAPLGPRRTVRDGYLRPGATVLERRRDNVDALVRRAVRANLVRLRHGGLGSGACVRYRTEPPEDDRWGAHVAIRSRPLPAVREHGDRHLVPGTRHRLAPLYGPGRRRQRAASGARDDRLRRDMDGRRNLLPRNARPEWAYDLRLPDGHHLRRNGSGLDGKTAGPYSRPLTAAGPGGASVCRSPT